MRCCVGLFVPSLFVMWTPLLLSIAMRCSDVAIAVQKSAYSFGGVAHPRACVQETVSPKKQRQAIEDKVAIRILSTMFVIQNCPFIK